MTLHLFARLQALGSLAIFASLLAIVLFVTGCTATPAAAEQPVPEGHRHGGRFAGDDRRRRIHRADRSFRVVEVRARVFGYLEVDRLQGRRLMSRKARRSSRSSPTNTRRSTSNRSRESTFTRPIWSWRKPSSPATQKLVKTRAVSREEYEEYVAAVQEAEARSTAAKADANRTAVDLKYTVLKAPISGRIDRAFVSKGNLLTGGWLRHAADQDCQRAADVRLLRCR